MKLHRALLALAVLFLVPIASWAGYKVNATAPDGFEEGISRVAVVTADCGAGLNCRAVESSVRGTLAVQSGWFVVGNQSVQEAMFKLGSATYTPELRTALAAELDVDAFLEMTLPRGEKGVFGWKGSEATVRLQLVKPTGEILMAGEGAGRGLNTMSSPESIAGATAKRILKKAF